MILPKGGDSRKKATDDQACQVYVTFPRFPQSVRSRTIGYVWDTTAPAGLFTPSEKNGTVHYVIVRSGAASSGSGPPRAVTSTRTTRRSTARSRASRSAVSVAVDSNDTQATAECYVGEILFKRP